MLNGGTLQLRNDASVTFATRSISVNTGGSSPTVTINVDHASAGTGNTLGLGAMTVDYDNATLAVTGGDGYALGLGATTLQYGSTKTKTISATTANVAIASVGGSGQNLSLSGSAGGNTIGAITTGTGTVTVNGGAWSLSGTSTYTGVTAVNSGELLLGPGGSLGNTAVSVAAGRPSRRIRRAAPPTREPAAADRPGPR